MLEFNLKSSLSQAFKKKNINEFHQILEREEKANSKIDFEIIRDILLTPNSGEFIHLLFQHAADFYEPDVDGFYPLYYAVKSLSDVNVTMLIGAESFKNKFQKIVNQKFFGRNNYLHDLVSQLNKENFDKVSKVIKVLVQFGCCINLMNSNRETPFSLLQKAKIDPKLKESLMDFIEKNANVNFKLNSILCNTRSKTVEIEMSQESDLDYLLQQIQDENEDEFLKHFNSFENFSPEFATKFEILLEAAIEKDSLRILEILLHFSVNVNAIPTSSRHNKEPAFLAASFGHVKVLEVLLQHENLNFESESRQMNLLHELLSSREVNDPSLREMFTLIVMDKRCTLDVINGEDRNGKTPLYFACVNRYHDIAIELMHRGAFVGSSDVLKVIKPQVFEKFLNESITKRENNSGDEEISINFQFLLNSDTSEPIKSQVLTEIKENEKLVPFLQHPTLTSFLELHWQAVKATHYIVSSLHFFGILYIVLTVAFFFKESEKIPRKWQIIIAMLYVFIFNLLVFLELYEITTNFKGYFFKLGNYFDLSAFILSFYAFIHCKTDCNNDEECTKSFVPCFQQIGAFLILIASAQCLKIFGASIYATIFRKACATFMKLILIYSIPLMAFVLSHFVLSDADQATQPPKNATKCEEEEGSKDEGIHKASFEVITMFAGDLDNERFKNVFSQVFVIIFIFFASITLQNVINSMAIVDTQTVINEAKIIGLTKKIQLLKEYETFFSMFKNNPFKIFSKRKFNKLILNMQGDRIMRYGEQFEVITERISITKKTDSRFKLSKDLLSMIEKFFDDVKDK